MKKKTKLAAGLIHYPVLNKRGEVMTTPVTILDVHDMARLCRTYDAAALHVITPFKSQRRLIKKGYAPLDERICRENRPQRLLPAGVVFAAISSCHHGRYEVGF